MSSQITQAKGGNNMCQPKKTRRQIVQQAYLTKKEEIWKAQKK